MYLFLVAFFQIHMGGMLYDRHLQKGVKRRYIPAPRIISLPGHASVIQKGVEIFFPEEMESLEIFHLADSSGTPFEMDTWSLSEFIKQLSLPPNKLYLYIMNFEKVWLPNLTVLVCNFFGVIFQTSGHEAEVERFEEASCKSSSQQGMHIFEHNIIHMCFSLVTETEAVILPCKSCSRPFRTYVPMTDCLMPDGTTFFYSEPQDECPCCDINQWGSHWNKDLFPEISD